MPDWRWEYRDYRPEQEGLREALCTLGNGYFAMRGAAIESSADGIHYPGTYLAGCYDRQVSEVQGRAVENEDLVNLPNGLLLRLFLDPIGGQPDDWFTPEAVTLLDYRQTLQLAEGLLIRAMRFRDSQARETALLERRLVHMHRHHLAALQLTLTPLNWSGDILVFSALDVGTQNQGVRRYAGLEGRHLEILETQALGDQCLLTRVRTRQSRQEMVLAARTRVFSDHQPLALEPVLQQEADFIAQRIPLRVETGQSVRIEKTLALHSTRDTAISEPVLAACSCLKQAPDFDQLAEEQALSWRQLWQRFDLRLTLGNGDSERIASILRLHLFHLLVTASPQVRDLDVGVPARGLHGEAYRGHIFWDELFIFPLLNLRLPQITRALLIYRYRRLGAARTAAAEAGLSGAMYPWQSGSDGREESQRLHLNPESGHWLPDDTHLQRHVGAAIAYNLWLYYQTTGDLEFLSFYGAEMLLEIARFWASLAVRNQALDRYEIHGVVGPDEFHTRHLDRDQPGLDNHAYTSLMACWVLCRALELPNELSLERWEELREQLAIDQNELDHWDNISRKLRLCFHGEGILSQFEGFGDLAELDWEAYRQRYGDIQRLDRLLEAEGDSVNRYQACKQADVLMLFYLFSAEELEALFDRLGYPMDPEFIQRNIAYYSARTSDGSTLSRVVDAWVLARSDRARSWSLFTEALESDVADIQGGTTAEGIHLGAMAGTVDLIQRCYTGIEVRDHRLLLNPQLPDDLQALELRLRFRGRTLRVRINHAQLRVHVEFSEPDPLWLRYGNQVFKLGTGDRQAVPIAETPLIIDARATPGCSLT